MKNSSIKNRSAKVKNAKTLLVNFIILSAIVSAVVIFTDSKGYFNPDSTNDHTERKWRSYYKFTKRDPVDVVIVGNSHCYTGINPKNMSAALGANCFVLASPGTTIMDSYFCLKEAFTRKKPKVAIIETFGISDTRNRELEAGKLSDQLKSFHARKNIPQKLLSTPVLFSPDNWPAAWSNTFRNHDFLLRDREQIKKNIALSKHKRPQDNSLYLGRFVRFTSGLTDSLLIKYRTDGAPVDGSTFKINKENRRYVNKIVKLCRRHDVTPVFITIPVYKMHIKNYDAMKKTLAEVIEPTGAAWFDMQEPYDQEKFNRECFENTYNQNQHMTYYGSLVVSYKVAHYLKEKLSVNLPERNKSQRWHQIFYGQEGYFENYPVADGDKVNKALLKNASFGQFKVDEVIYSRSMGSSSIIVKVPKSQEEASTINLEAALKFDGKNAVARLPLRRALEYDPFGHDIYKTYLNNRVEILDVRSMQFEE